MTISSSVRIAVATFLISLFCMPSGASELDDQLDKFLTWFPGEYDNYEQAWQDKLDEVAQPHEHIHHIFYPVAAPEIGEHIFFVQQYMDGDPENIYRQRLYKLEKDTRENALRLTIFSFQDEPDVIFSIKFKNLVLE